MNTDGPQFSKTGLTVAGIASVLALVATNMGAIEYIKGEFSGVFASSQIRAMFLGVAMGVSFTSWVPYVFGEAFNGAWAKILTKLFASLITFAIAWEMHNTGTGMYCAMFAGLAGTQIYSTLTNYFYQAFPAIVPPAMRD